MWIDLNAFINSKKKIRVGIKDLAQGNLNSSAVLTLTQGFLIEGTFLFKSCGVPVHASPCLFIQDHWLHFILLFFFYLEKKKYLHFEEKYSSVLHKNSLFKISF